MKVIILNGPPRSGKDTLAKLILSHLGAAYLRSFGSELKLMTHRLYGMVHSKADAFEEVKDEPSISFNGLTPRQAYINVHELYLKPVHGLEALGDLLVKSMRRRGLWSASTLIITDAGSVEECMPIVRKYGTENITLVRIEKEGCEWNDNRTKIELERVRTFDIVNPGDSTLMTYLPKLTGKAFEE